MRACTHAHSHACGHARTHSWPQYNGSGAEQHGSGAVWHATVVAEQCGITVAAEHVASRKSVTSPNSVMGCCDVDVNSTQECVLVIDACDVACIHSYGKFDIQHVTYNVYNHNV